MFDTLKVTSVCFHNDSLLTDEQWAKSNET